MAAGGREFAIVAEGIYDKWYPHHKKIATKVLELNWAVLEVSCHI